MARYATERMSITAIRGFNDILPGESETWARVEESARSIFSSYGFKEIRLPVLEKTELFLRTIGDTTDIVEKQMYSFEDRHGDGLTLRPEGTAPAVRAYIEHKLYTNSPVTKLYYFGAMFRYERPQKGRYRQFHQIGAELLGDTGPFTDAETISMLTRLLKTLGVEGVAVELNSLGCSSCRPAYKDALTEFLSAKTSSLCENCQRRIGANPLRALDCKSEHCISATKDAPSSGDYLCQECLKHFEGVRENLTLLNVDYELNSRMVRGLDYYTKTAFEVTARTPGALGAQNAVAAGGRYDNLVKELGGPSTPCFGFAIGMERLTQLVPPGRYEALIPVYIATFGAGTTEAGVRIAKRLREKSITVELDAGESSLKSKLKRADKSGAKFAIIIGENELKENSVAIKNLSEGTQEKLSIEEAVSKLSGTPR